MLLQNISSVSGKRAIRNVSFFVFIVCIMAVFFCGCGPTVYRLHEPTLSEAELGVVYLPEGKGLELYAVDDKDANDNMGNMGSVAGFSCSGLFAPSTFMNDAKILLPPGRHKLLAGFHYVENRGNYEKTYHSKECQALEIDVRAGAAYLVTAQSWNDISQWHMEVRELSKDEQIKMKLRKPTSPSSSTPVSSEAQPAGETKEDKADSDNNNNAFADGTNARCIRSMNGNIDTAQELNIHAKTNYYAGSEPGSPAVESVMAEVVEMVRGGFDLAANPSLLEDIKIGATLLMCASASKQEHPEVVQTLLEKGSDINARNPRGRTALWMAAHNGYFDTVTLLLRGGADININDEKGKTPLDVAIENNHTKVAELLKQHVARESNAKASSPLKVKMPPATAVTDSAASVADLLEKLKSPTWKERRSAAFELGKLRTIKAVPSLLELLDDENSTVCGAAAMALGRIGDRRALKPLIGLLEDESPHVRAAAAKALMYLKDKRATNALKETSKDESPEVRKAAAAALNKLR